MYETLPISNDKCNGTVQRLTMKMTSPSIYASDPTRRRGAEFEKAYEDGLDKSVIEGSIDLKENEIE